MDPRNLADMPKNLADMLIQLKIEKFTKKHPYIYIYYENEFYKEHTLTFIKWLNGIGVKLQTKSVPKWLTINKFTINFPMEASTLKGVKKVIYDKIIHSKI